MSSQRPMDTDVLVIGAGTAGMPCAIAAAEAGARVSVLERTSEVGGTLHASGGSMSAAGAQRALERGIEDSPAAHFEDVMRLGGQRADPRLVRLATEQAAGTIDWLDGLGFPFQEDSPRSTRGYSAARLYFGVAFGRSVLATIAGRWERLVGAGAIDVRFEHTLRSLIVERDTVVGARADAAGGTVELRAPAVVLATGGYGANPALFSQLTPGNPRIPGISWPTATGDGLIAARAAGAALRNWRDLYSPT